MSLIIEVKINTKPIYRLSVENQTGKMKGLNPYKVFLYDAKTSDLLGESMVVHEYEEGPIALSQRALQAINHNPMIQHAIIRTPTKNIRQKS